MRAPSAAICNLFLVVFVLIAAAYIHRRWPNWRPKAWFVVLLLGLLPLASMLAVGSFESGDLSLHATRAMAFYQALLDGDLIPRWAGSLNAGYGYPLFQFIYPLPYYLIALFHRLGFSFITSTKLLLSSSFVLSGLSMFTWIRSSLGKKAGVIAAVFYLFAPYHLVDLYFRADVGEVLAFMFVPLVFWGVDLIRRGRWWKGTILGGLSYAALICSHQAVAVGASYLVFAYLLWWLWRGEVRAFFRSIALFVLGLFLSSWYWLPALSRSTETFQSQMNGVEFLSLSQLLFSAWRWGFLFQGPKGELAFVLGGVQLFLIGIGVIIWRVRREPTLGFALLCIVGVTLFMMPVSSPLWSVVPFVSRFQFAYRLLSLVCLETAVVAAFVLKRMPKRLVMLLCGVAILSTILNWSNRATLPWVSDQTLSQELPAASAAGEGLVPALPSTLALDHLWEKTPSTEPITLLGGEGNITVIEHKNSRHRYHIEATTPIAVREATLWFPGWVASANGASVRIDRDHDGIMNLILPAGNYLLELRYQ